MFYEAKAYPTDRYGRGEKRTLKDLDRLRRWAAAYLLREPSGKVIFTRIEGRRRRVIFSLGKGHEVSYGFAG